MPFLSNSGSINFKSPINIVLFTVVIPTKNRPSSLVEAIKSVQRQSLNEWEIIIVDDASQPETRCAVEPFLSERIRYVRSETSNGPGATRNRGILLASPISRYISLLDDDDQYFPDFLRITHEALRDSSDDIGFSWTGIENCYVENGTCDTFFWDPPFKTKEEAFAGFLEKRLIGTGYGITFKKSVFEKVGYFDETLKAVEDTDFFIRVLKYFFYKNIPDILVKITRQDTGNHVMSIEKLKALETIFDKHRSEIPVNSKTWFRFHAKISSGYFRLGRRETGRSVLRNALKAGFSLKIVLLWLKLEIG